MIDAYITTINHIKPWPITFKEGLPRSYKDKSSDYYSKIK